MTEVFIIFPPLTEARFFLYLSFPMITSYLRSKGISTKQKDFNIQLCHNLFSEVNFDKYCRNLLEKRNLKNKYRLEVAKFFSKYSIPDKNDIAFEVLENILYNSILDINPKIFAISIAYYSKIFPSLLLAKIAKRLNPNLIIIIGGQQVVLRKDIFMKNHTISHYIDALEITQGEETIYFLAIYAKNGVSKYGVPNVIWLDHNPITIDKVHYSQIKLDNLTPPDFDDLPIHGYLNEEIQIPLITFIGCYWGSCAFCSYGNRSKFENNYQQYSVNKLSEMCKYIVNKYDIKRINFVDENCNLILRTRSMKIFNSENDKIKFSVRNRMEAQLTNKNFCKSLSELGCVLMSCGYKTNSQRLLDILDKGVNTNHYQLIIDNMYENGITLRFLIIDGLPGETKDEFEESLSFLKKNESKIGIDTMQMLICEPENFLSENPEKYGIQISSKDQYLGNKTLSYGMGRVGYSYEYIHEDKKFKTEENNYIVSNLSTQKIWKVSKENFSHKI
jgi:anaerobic magnesium-protoporphyrin IX monomethyl ester cyclase